MKNLYFLAFIFLLALPSNAQNVNTVIIQIQKPQSFYLNGGTRSSFGGKSRTIVQVDLPPNTIEWFYSVTTHKGEGVSNNLNLFSQLLSIYDMSGTASLAANAIATQPGSNSMDVYLLTDNEVNSFLKKEAFSYVISGSRENFKNGTVQIKDTGSDKYFLGLRNPSSLNGININLEIAAVVKDENGELRKEYSNIDYKSNNIERSLNDDEKPVMVSFDDDVDEPITKNSIVKSDPNLDEIKDVIKKVKALEFEEHSIYNILEITNEDDINIVHGSFTKLNNTECLISIPMASGLTYMNLLLLMERNNLGSWIYKNWHHMGSSTVDLIDVDNDGVTEIILEGGDLRQGILSTKYQLISLKDGIEKKLYENEGFSYGGNPIYQESEKGTVISKTIGVSYKSLLDGTMQIEEKIAIGKFDYFDKYKDRIVQSYTKETNSYQLENGKYVKK